MSAVHTQRGFGGLIYLGLAGILGLYFTFAAVHGDFGVFRRVQISSEKEALTAERDRLRGETDRMSNLTRRMSDDFLDLDLLDEQVRSTLGYVRSDEIVIR